MDWVDQHHFAPHARFDGGNLDCGNGLLLLLRRHLDPLTRGQLLEMLSTESSVEEDLPAWSRMTGNELVSGSRRGEQRSFLIRKGGPAERPKTQLEESPRRVVPDAQRVLTQLAERAAPYRESATAPTIGPLSVMGIGSWPRPRWMLQAIHDYLEHRLDEAAFHQTADDAVRLAVSAQERAGVDVVTDGEQRRDSYASFVGTRLDNCQLVPVMDLLPYVEDPRKFEEELRALDVPADLVRHPAILGKLSRSRPLAVHELQFTQTLTKKPIKVALPGPYLLTRTMWLECVSDRVYEKREDLAADIVRVLREEVCDLLAAGVAVVQFDEPVLTEIVFGRPDSSRSFMCGALSARQSPALELAFAASLINQVTTGLPAHRLALHVCRGNWSRDERVALRGDYGPLVAVLGTLQVGTLLLEMCTPRAGDLEVLRELPGSYRLGIGVVNQKTDTVEPVDTILARAERAIGLFGPERVLLTPDCGFATFADNPLASARNAEAKLAAVAEAARLLRQRHGIAPIQDAFAAS